MLSKIATSRAPAVSRLLQSQNICRRRITKHAQSPIGALAASESSSPSFSSFPTTKRRQISYTSSNLAKITVDVPTMGDSITEGTIIEWCVPPGSHVRDGDVLALIETDKVTIDIKADREGVLVKQLGEVDEEVEVGSGLYILDTDVSNVVASAPVVEAVSQDVSKVNKSLDAHSKPAASALAASGAPSVRVPSIHFLGKDGWKARRTATEESPAVAAASPTTIVPASNNPNAPTSITEMKYSSMFGRPPITDDEMEALILGGADEAPEVHSVVSGDGLSGFVFVGGKVVTAGPRGVWLAE